MRVLVDAHAILWFVWDHESLTAKARTVMEDAASDLLLSAGTLWEIAIKVGLRKLNLTKPYELFMEDAIADNDLTILPISLAHATALTTLPLHHRDPFDRLLIAQALAEHVPIVSCDPAFDAYPITRIW